MTEAEALDMAAKAAGWDEAALYDEPWVIDGVKGGVVFKALCRAIEQHEAFRQEVSDVVSELSSEYTSMGSYYADKLKRFIIAKPDPLVEALEEASGTNDPVEWANRFYAAIEKRGGKIVWGEG